MSSTEPRKLRVPAVLTVMTLAAAVAGAVAACGDEKPDECASTGGDECGGHGGESHTAGGGGTGGEGGSVA